MAPNIQFSESGTLVYLPAISRSDNSMVWVDRNGDITSAFGLTGDFSSPRISPDGKKIAVKLDSDIWVYEIKGGSGVKITFGGKNSIPLWSQDRESVFYASEKDEQFAVVRKNADGSGRDETIHTSKNRVAPYSIHPTENVLAIAIVNPQGDRDIITKSLADNSTADLVVTDFREDTPRFSPNGKWYAYFSMDTGKPQIYVHPWKNAEKKIPITKESGMFPVWSPTSDEIFYRTANRFYAARLKTSPEFDVVDTKLMFEGRFLTSFDVAPDGNRFLMVKDKNGTLPKKLSIILNWREELWTIQINREI